MSLLILHEDEEKEVQRKEERLGSICWLMINRIQIRFCYIVIRMSLVIVQVLKN